MLRSTISVATSSTLASGEQLTTSRVIEAQTGLSHVTVNKTLDRLCEMSLTREITGRKRDRVFSYVDYITILNEGTELPGASS